MSASQPELSEQPQTVPTARPPRVTRADVKNFRLLRNVSVAFDKDVTVCVGRNNTGKTSLAEVLSRFLRPGDIRLRVEDFSAESYPEFTQAYKAFVAGDEEAARKLLPEISLTIFISYDKDTTEYGPLSSLIVDLDLDCTEAVVTVRYALKPGAMKDFFRGGPDDLVEGWGESVLLALVGPRITHLFERSAIAVDPADVTNFRSISMAAVARAIKVDFVKAQRGLDDEKERLKEPIGKVLESLFIGASKADGDSLLKGFANDAESALDAIFTSLDEQLQDMYNKMAPTVSDFGYPGLGNRNFSTRTTLDTKRLLSNFTSIRYPGSAGIELPESYSGLGSRNLLLILLTLFSYYREYAAQRNQSCVHLVFIEEPEAHLHPQMQEIFIHQLGVFKQKFPVADQDSHSWNAQFLVTTHSAHIANRVGFSAVRYFRLDEYDDPDGATSSQVLNLADAPGVSKDFLHKYLTLTRADLFFADKAILIEGTSERLFIPAAIARSDRADGEKRGSLSSQYVAVMEVGGAYAHLFYPFLDFLGLPTLVITDLDAVKPSPKKLESCCVSEGTTTSNEGIKKWFAREGITLAELVQLAEEEIPVTGRRGLVYQVPETIGGACGRTFEDAFILANPALFNLDDVATRGTAEREQQARDIAKGQKKSNFALRFAIEEENWEIPRYIKRGLDWLLDQAPTRAEADMPESGASSSDTSPDSQVAVG
ncbi:putative ATP-dependent endonuclease of OLD family [Kitasatospora sp. MAP12-15]|uniref:ATP-dependent nuclease n=1 Tax=unclassified Kitasatospora TaxID=2633591 RepID=UPI002476764B|nr:ATP-dependent endonuclease [Kitasatospora sp. MAP12-44]MDH6112552.1 putative ATP-dependent endonuclease of OLD family [Kitasatospora sp. MAP12-44]